ncbi:hypothetical protein ACF1BU_03745 [Streptomyces sp. NPDC014724]|uniref:hypothetical protein n=1 Tax=unclassified Streptomyces TaxID=2593676 RepID=UPI0036FE659E
MLVLSHRRRLTIATGIALVAGAVAAPLGHATTEPTTPAASTASTPSTPSTKRLHDDFNAI